MKQQCIESISVQSQLQSASVNCNPPWLPLNGSTFLQYNSTTYNDDMAWAATWMYRCAPVFCWQGCVPADCCRVHGCCLYVASLAAYDVQGQRTCKRLPDCNGRGCPCSIELCFVALCNDLRLVRFIRCTDTEPAWDSACPSRRLNILLPFLSS